MGNPHSKQRINEVQKLIKHKKLECLLLTTPANVTYTTGFTGHDSWAAITPHQVYLLTDSRYTEQAEKECQHCQVLERSGSMAQLVASLCKRLRRLRTLHIEDAITCSSFAALKKAVAIPVKTSSSIEGQRSLKDPWERKLTRQSVRMAITAFERTIQEIQPGLREFEVAALLDYHIRRQDATNAFDTIVAFGPNGSHPHHQPGSRKLKANDTILMDFGARYRGYCSDITRSFSIGRTAPLFSKAYQTVREAQVTAIKALRPNVKLSDVDQSARHIIQEAGFPVYGHGTGHGIGLNIHEAPSINSTTPNRAQSGQIVTVEPGIYLPGKFGIRLEEDVLITDKGAKILTQACQQVSSLEDMLRSNEA